MTERNTGAPKSTERKVEMGREHEKEATEIQPYHKTPQSFFDDVAKTRKKLYAEFSALDGKDLKDADSTEVLAHARDLQEASDAREKYNAEYEAMGGAALDAARKNLAMNSSNPKAREAVRQAEAAVYENYLNRHNEFAQISAAERTEFIQMVAEDLPDEDDPHYFQKIAELQEDWMMGQGKMTRSQADYAVEAAMRMKNKETERSPAASEAPEGLPTTEKARAAAKAVEDEPVKANILKRAWDGLNVKVMNGMFRVGEFLTRKNEEGTRRKPGETDEAYEKRMKRKGTVATLAGVAIGAAFIGYKAAVVRGWMADGLENSGGSGGGETLAAVDGETGSIGVPNRVRGIEEYPTMDGGSGSAEASGDEFAPGSLGSMDMLDTADRIAESADLGGVDTFEGTMFDGYNPAEDAFNMPGKTGELNWGAPLPTELTAGAHFDVAGLDELVSQGWSNSPEQLATVAAEFGLEGFDTSNIEMMAEQMKSDPGFAHDTYMQMLEQLNGSDIRISEGEPLLPGTYGSYHESMVDGNGVISYDNVVNEPGTTIKFELLDDEGNVLKVVEIKRECGGQIIHRHPVAESVPMGGAAPVAEYVPSGTVPQGGATPEVPYNPSEIDVPVDTPVETPAPPSGGSTPPPVETVPPVETTPPVELDSKIPARGINANPGLPEQLKMGDQAGTIQPGELDTTPVAPPDTYIPPEAPAVSTEIVGDAASNARTDAVGTGVEAPVPAAEAGVTGEAATDVSSGRVEG